MDEKYLLVVNANKGSEKSTLTLIAPHHFLLDCIDSVQMDPQP